MAKFHWYPVLFLLYAAPLSLVAQERVPAPIEPLLRSDEPRLIALGAWEVIRRQDDSLNPLLVEFTERWDPEHRPELQSRDWLDAMTVVLDALVQRKVPISPAAALAVLHAFPDQALILIARMDSADAEPILRSLYREGRGGPRNGREQPLLTRIAVMFLARDHPSEIAASMLTDSVAQLAVSVPSPRYPGIERCLTGCDSPPPCKTETIDEPRIGWPHIFQYVLEENEPLHRAQERFADLRRR